MVRLPCYFPSCGWLLGAEQEFDLLVNVAPPGGRLQARFFDILLPYLPTADKEALAKIRQAETVDYKEANAIVKLDGKDSLKILLNIRVPEYNLNLNLNLTVHVEDNEAFFQLAHVMGIKNQLLENEEDIINYQIHLKTLMNCSHSIEIKENDMENNSAWDCLAQPGRLYGQGRWRSQPADYH